MELLRLRDAFPRLFASLLLGTCVYAWGQDATRSEGTTVSLRDSYLAAIKRSETVSNQEQTIVQAEERVSQAFGSILPNLTGHASYLIQDTPSDPLAVTFFPRMQPNVRLTVTQPLFRGFREFAGLRQLRRLKDSQKETLEQVLLQLYTQVAETFFNILSLEQEIRNLDTQTELLNQRVIELKTRVRTGQSNATEVLTADSANASIQAQHKQVEGLLNSSREMFLFLTGLPRETKLKEPENFEIEKRPLEDYLNGTEKRPDILAAKDRVEVSEEGIRIAKGEHYPTIDLIGNYYLVRPPGVYEGINWDVQASLILPIYAGGVIQSRVRETASQMTQAELSLARIRRIADEEVRAFFATYQSSLQQIEALEKATQLAAENYRLLRRDYARGLARNIDVLQALTDLQERRRALSRVKYTSQFNLIRLRIASGARSEGLLK